jgi:hypothetical protein
VGYNQGTVSNSFSTGPVSGSFWLGGLVGRNNFVYSTVSNCYSTGSVSGTYDYIGGLIGENYSSTISNSYSTGSVTGRKYVGGLIGQNNRIVADSFWDTLTSGQAVSAGGSGLSTIEMQTISTYLSAGWDMEKTWMICEGQDYPRLRWEERECP